jgi:hypothetical protein
MTEQSPLARYLVRKGTRDWMVWDREAKAPAMLRGRLAIRLSEERAREIKDELIKIAGGL